jgi:hypothetical protein
MKFQRFSKTHTCPACQSSDIYRLKRSTVANRIVCKFSNYRPHWCSNCDAFFYALKHPKTVHIDGTYGVSHQSTQHGNHPRADGLTH